MSSVIDHLLQTMADNAAKDYFVQNRDKGQQLGRELLQMLNGERDYRNGAAAAPEVFGLWHREEMNKKKTVFSVSAPPFQPRAAQQEGTKSKKKAKGEKANAKETDVKDAVASGSKNAKQSTPKNGKGENAKKESPKKSNSKKKAESEQNAVDDDTVLIQYDRQRLLCIGSAAKKNSMPSWLKKKLKDVRLIKPNAAAAAANPLQMKGIPPFTTEFPQYPVAAQKRSFGEKIPSIVDALPRRPNVVGFTLDPIMGAWVPRQRPSNGM